MFPKSLPLPTKCKGLFPFLLLVFLFPGCDKKKEGSSLSIDFDGVKYEQLNLHLIRDDGNVSVIQGKTRNHWKWNFEIPDSLYERHRYLTFIDPSKKEAIRQIEFYTAWGKDTVHSSQFSLSKGNLKTNAVYDWSQSGYHSGPFHARITDFFFISAEKDPALYVSIKAQFETGIAGWTDFPDYNERVARFSQLVTQYPDSHYLLAKLDEEIPFFITKEDINHVFMLFTDDLKQAFLGRKIQKRLETWCSPFKHTGID